MKTRSGVTGIAGSKLNISLREVDQETGEAKHVFHSNPGCLSPCYILIVQFSCIFLGRKVDVCKRGFIIRGSKEYKVLR